MRNLFVLLTVLFIGGGSVAAQEDAYHDPSAARFDARRARVLTAPPGRGLTLPSKAAPAAIVREFLRAQGHDETALSVVAEGRAPRTGLIHLRLEQEVQGLKVHGAYAKAAVNSVGELVHLIDNLAAAPQRGVLPARIGQAEALNAVLQRLFPGIDTTARSFFYRTPSVTPVAVLMANGTMQAGFLVETWTNARNLLHHTVVSGDGRILLVEPRTNRDSYNVFLVDPDKSLQTVVSNPAGPESPLGWLNAGNQNSVHIAGNNANAYLDTNADNVPDAGGTTITDGNFLAVADLTVTPATTDNRAVAVQNLFFMNNVLHDRLYAAGFIEAAGNFQENNFGLGGLGSDSVNAEAQDGSGVDNANFSTPPDGGNPRMQMFLWTAVGTHELVVHSPGSIAGTYLAAGAQFGPNLDGVGITGNVVPAFDGRGVKTDACSRVLNRTALAGNVAIVYRGTCEFVVKALNVQRAGAIAMIVVNNEGDDVFTMGGFDSRIVIPSEMIGLTDGNTIKSGLASGVNATLRRSVPPPPMRDSSLDSDVVYHEYGHGLTWRMIGNMSGVMSGAIGEGMSDALSVVLNGDDVVGEYSTHSSVGIRSEPYDAYSRTYGDFSNTGVHFDGEIYGAIGWRLLENYTAAGLTSADLLDDMVGGMNFTPAGPAFEDMRDGILAQVAAAGNGRECLVWTAFAEYGVGVGATSVVIGGTATVTESFALPAECTP
jgi:hypothetical protein